MSILCFILHRTVDHRLVKTIGQFVYLTVQVNLKCKWDSRDIESIKCGTIGIKPFKPRPEVRTPVGPRPPPRNKRPRVGSTPDGDRA